MATTKHDVPPLLDIQNAEFANQYQEGAYWARYGDEQGNGPQPDTYFIVNVTMLIESGHFNDLQSAWFPNLGFFLGMVPGGLLIPQTGELRPDVTTLVTLSDPCMIRGYRAGRVWFFYEASPDERRLTDTYLMQRFHELATESHEYMDAQGTINFALGCILGELSGQVFPITQEEHECIQEEDRQFMAEYEAQWAKAGQEQGTKPLRATVLQDA
jgi:hypothetical protein